MARHATVLIAIAALGLAAGAAPAAAAPTFSDSDFSGATSEGGGVTFAIGGGGTTVGGFRFVNRCFPDPSAGGVAAPASMKIQTTYRPKRKKGAKKRPKPRPLAEPIFGYSGSGFTIKGTFQSSTHAEGTLRWVSSGGCDTGTLNFSADVIVLPK
jgi:hypothetical protein